MKTRILTQAQKAHNTNQLHDAFVVAGLIPIHVESDSSESRFTLEDAVADAAIDNVITTYVFSAPAAPIDIRQKWIAYNAAVNNATSIAQLKSALTDDLRPLLKELFRSRVADL